MDRLISLIEKKNNPSVIGLDPVVDYIPAFLKEKHELVTDAILEFNLNLIDSFADVVAAIKPQLAYYEIFGSKGIEVYEKTAAYAKEKGLYIIADGKRNDIGSTAGAYAEAYLGEKGSADALTVNGYLGIDGVKPFLDKAVAYDKDIFVLAKTSNPSSGELQDLKLESGEMICEKMMELLTKWGSETVGKYGYSRIGAVVGATYPEQLASMRKNYGEIFFLVPGYGFQGGGAEGVRGGFDKNGFGSVVNSSRAVMLAYKKEGDEKKYAEAARKEVVRMRDELNTVR
ncbi:MAG: orotidine-5'-phosphate decarboxylase [Clostridia bacterium]|nr:orotidine-5'-phosphate decarboxylase [Clostridia bacterium]